MNVFTRTLNKTSLPSRTDLILSLNDCCLNTNELKENELKENEDQKSEFTNTNACK